MSISPEVIVKTLLAVAQDKLLENGIVNVLPVPTLTVRLAGPAVAGNSKALDVIDPAASYVNLEFAASYVKSVNVPPKVIGVVLKVEILKPPKTPFPIAKFVPNDPFKVIPIGFDTL